MIKSLILETKKVMDKFLFQSEVKCQLCGKKGVIICHDCENEYFLPDELRCTTCGKICYKQEICTDCASGKGPTNLTRVTSLGYYSGAWKDYIHKVKYMSQPYLLNELAQVLTVWAIKHLRPPDLIVPVPMHHSRLAQRGYNQAEVLASVLSRNLGINQGNILTRKRDTIPQSSLGREERLENIQRAFELHSPFSIVNLCIWIVDDIITTGATIGECAKILKEYGAGEIYAICLGAGKEDNQKSITGHES